MNKTEAKDYYLWIDPIDDPLMVVEYRFNDLLPIHELVVAKRVNVGNDEIARLPLYLNNVEDSVGNVSEGVSIPYAKQDHNAYDFFALRVQTLRELIHCGDEKATQLLEDLVSALETVQREFLNGDINQIQANRFHYNLFAIFSSVLERFVWKAQERMEFEGKYFSDALESLSKCESAVQDFRSSADQLS